MSVTALSALAITLSISILAHAINFIINRRPKFVVVGRMSYKEFNSWHKAKEYINNQLGEYQVFIYEKGEYTYITSSYYNNISEEVEVETEI